MRVLLVLCALLLGAAAWASEPDVYVRNVSVPPPRVFTGGDVYVPRETLLVLYKGGLTAEALAALKVAPLQRQGAPWFPVLAVARALGWDVRRQHEVGIIDVVSPLRVRMENTRRGETPLDPNEREVAEEGKLQVMAQYGRLSGDAALLKRTLSIGTRVARASPRSHIKWQFFVLETRELQALSVGPYVFVTRGLLEKLDDAELAGALGHEVAHSCLRHSMRGYEEYALFRDHMRHAISLRDRLIAMEQQGINSGAEYETTERQLIERIRALEAVMARLEVTMENVDPWEDEREADRHGMMYAREAGFSPLGMIFCLQKLQEMEKDAWGTSHQGIPQASTHPPLALRIRLAREVHRKYFAK